MSKKFKVKNKNGDTIGTVKHFDPVKLANNFKPRGLATICFMLMAASTISMVGEAVKDIQDTRKTSPIASSQIEYVADDLVNSAQQIVTAPSELKGKVDSVIEYADMLVEKYKEQGYIGEQAFIQEVNRYYEVKDEYLNKDFLDYDTLVDIRDVLTDICESFTSIAKKHAPAQPHQLPVAEYEIDRKRKGRM